MDTKHKKRLRHIMVYTGIFIGAFGIGLLLAEILNHYHLMDIWRSIHPLWIILLLLAFVFLSIILQVIIHESGHLIFGLLSGYHFVSFRIGSIILIHNEGKWQLKRFSIPGTGGQCLMSPPDMEDGKIPYRMFNMGGAIMNLATCVVSIILLILIKEHSIWSGFLILFALFGLIFGLTNGIPIHGEWIDNDGYNALNLGKNPEALRAFWITLKINALNSRGKRLTEMPLEWFKIPAEKDLMNPLICSLAVFSENRVMESRDYETAKDLIDWLSYIKTGMVPIYRAMLQCDRIFCELMVNGPTPKVDILLTPSLDKIMQKMKTYPSVIRTRYALALLKNKDEKEALRIKKRFASASFRHPYPAEFKSEEKLLIDVDRKYRTLLK